MGKRILKFFFGKSKNEEKDKKTEETGKGTATKAIFNEAIMNDNYFDASKEATLGREIMFETVKGSINRDIESAKGFHFEAHQVNSVNIKAAKEGIAERKVMHESEISSKYRGVKKDSHSPMDASTVMDGKVIEGTGAQMKGSNKASDAYKYLKKGEEKYIGMEKAVIEGQAAEIQEIALAKGKTEIADTVTEKISLKSEITGKKVYSDPTSQELIKDRNRLKRDAIKTEIKTSIESATMAGAQAGVAAATLKLVDDLVEKREIEYRNLLGAGTDAAISAIEYTLVKDVVVNKLKIIGSKGFTNTAVALGMASDIKRLAEMSINGTDSYTIADETTATVARMSVGFTSKALLGIPGCGPAASVVVGYVGSKIIQQLFYSEIKMQLRTQREENNNNDKILKILEQRKVNLEIEIERFLNEIESVCEKRLNVINRALALDTEEGYIAATEILTNKKISRTTDKEIDMLFDEGLKI